MRRKRGFTLVELMIVVVILGILSAIAIPLYLKFVQQSKTGEAKVNLAKIATLLEEYYAKSANQGTNSAIQAGTSNALIARFPAASPCAGSPRTNTDAVPQAANAVQARKYQPAASDWKGPWELMHFAIAQPIQFKYCYAGAGTGIASSFSVFAQGDIDGDNAWSLYTRIGEVDDAEGRVSIGPLAILNEDE